MATIALYANKINQMPGLIKDAKKAVNGIHTQLGIVKRKCMAVDSGICNLDDVISQITASTKVQEEKIAALEAFNDHVEQFVETADRIDDEAADKINRNKDDFYNQYSHLKPDCEKSIWEKICEGCKKVGQWCKEHWKQIATVVLVVAAIGILIAAAAGALVGAAAVLLLAAAKGVLIGTAVGGLAGGLVSSALGGSFWEGFWDGAFGGAVSGMLSGLCTQWLSMGMKIAAATGSRVSLTCLQTMVVNGLAEGLSSILSDVGDMLSGVKEISLGDLVYNAAFAAGLGALVSKFVYDLPAISIKGITVGRGSWNTIWTTQTTKTIKYRSLISIQTILKGIGADFTQDIFNHLAEILKSLVSSAKTNAMAPKPAVTGGVQ